jgi:hypothetical protein
MQSAFDIQFTFLDMSHSTTAGRLPRNAPELRRAETTASAAQLQASLQEAPVEQLRKNHDILDHSAVK